MSKLNSKKISFNESDFLVEISENDVQRGYLTKKELARNIAQNQAEQEIDKVKKQANQILAEAKNKAKTILDDAQQEANKILEQAQQQAQSVIEEANTNKENIETDAKNNAESVFQEHANKGYKEGYDDAQEKFYEENEEKIKNIADFCSKQIVVRDKILKNASREILSIIENISKAVLLKEIDSQALDKIIKKTVSLFDKKENIKIVLSEKYARLLFEIQNKKEDEEFNFENFKQYQGFEIIYNKELPDDTIIIENPKERFDASIKSQTDKIIREILDKTQNGNLDIEEYDETSTAE